MHNETACFANLHFVRVKHLEQIEILKVSDVVISLKKYLTKIITMFELRLDYEYNK